MNLEIESKEKKVNAEIIVVSYLIELFELLKTHLVELDVVLAVSPRDVATCEFGVDRRFEFVDHETRGVMFLCCLERKDRVAPVRFGARTPTENCGIGMRRTGGITAGTMGLLGCTGTFCSGARTWKCSERKCGRVVAPSPTG